MVHDLQVSRQCHKISRNVGNLIDLLTVLQQRMLLVAIREAFGVNPRDVDLKKRQKDDCVEITCAKTRLVLF